MGSNDMDHMIHLESVALSDCAVLHSKEATYQGSWKRAGGRSAWFMARRNLDRLITMMAPPEVPDGLTPATVREVIETVQSQRVGDRKLVSGDFAVVRENLKFLLASHLSENIFAKIAEHPGGEDGTVLACMRDARRYFMLVEAEMIAEGVVEPESKTYEQETRVYVEPDTDVYQMIADEKHITRQEVKDRIHALFNEVAFPPAASHSNGGYAAEQAERRRAEAVSDGGSQHAVEALYPWQATKKQIDTLRQRHGTLVDLFYTQRAGDVWQLEPIVRSQHCPKEIYLAYRYAGPDQWTIKRVDVPLEIWDNFPQLLLEMNTKEHEESRPDFRFMYEYHESSQKWTLKPQFAEWGRETG